MEPYNEAKPLYTASLNLHSTLVILRCATRYLHLSRRLALQIAETNPQKAAIDPHAILRATITISELSIPRPPLVLKKRQLMHRRPTIGSAAIGSFTRYAKPR
jgi:hypothetical protein